MSLAAVMLAQADMRRLHTITEFIIMNFGDLYIITIVSLIPGFYNTIVCKIYKRSLYEYVKTEVVFSNEDLYKRAVH